MARSIVNQGLLLQRETVPGNPLVTAMRRVQGIRAMPSWNIETTEFRASGFKLDTSSTVETETGEPDIDAIQDYNAFTYLLTGMAGAPVTTQPDAVGAPSVYRHVYTLNPTAADPVVTFTAMWGDTTQALQMPHFFFNSFGITIERGDLSIDSSAMSYKPVTGVAFPTTGITTVASQPVASRTYDVFADNTWAALGTTKLLAAYSGEINFGDKYVPDYVLNSAKSSFDSIVEADDTDYDGTLRVGFDSAAVGLVGAYNDGALRFFRFRSVGPLIAATYNYTLQLDFCARIRNPNSISDDGSVVSLEFDLLLAPDPVSGNAAVATLTNTVAAL